MSAAEGSKPTAGPWRVHDKNAPVFANSEFDLTGYARVGFGAEDPFDGTLLIIDRRNDGCEEFRERAVADARLIAEAGNVYHETGKSPRQLADEVERLSGVVLQFGDAQMDASAQIERLTRGRDALIDALKVCRQEIKALVESCGYGIFSTEALAQADSAIALAEQQQTAGGES